MSHSESTQTDADSERQAQVPEPEILPRAMRRRFSVGYNLRILRPGRHPLTLPPDRPFKHKMKGESS